MLLPYLSHVLEKALRPSEKETQATHARRKANEMKNQHVRCFQGYHRIPLNGVVGFSLTDGFRIQRDRRSPEETILHHPEKFGRVRCALASMMYSIYASRLGNGHDEFNIQEYGPTELCNMKLSTWRMRNRKRTSVSGSGNETAPAWEHPVSIRPRFK